MDHISPGVIAVLLGMVLCFALVTPWVAHRHRRRGGIGLQDGVTAVATVVACVALATYTLMPLPAPWLMTCTRPAGVQLIPFAFIADTLRQPGAAVQVLLNVGLFLPIGFLTARSRWRHPILLTALVGAGGSLAVELTQLTAVWGLWPCAFRVFDVDDLIANTAGAIGGAVLSALIARPPRRRMSPNLPRTMTPTRRLLGMVCDAALLILGGWIAATIVAVSLAAFRLDAYDRPGMLLATIGQVVPVIGFGATAVVIGRTPGEWAVRLRPASRPHPARMILRLLLGSAGWSLLRLLPDLSWSAVVLAAVSIACVYVIPRRDGVACWLAGIRMTDDRVPRTDERSSPTSGAAWRTCTGAGLAISLLALTVSPAGLSPFPRNGDVDVYEPPTRFGVRFLEDLSSTTGSPLRGVVMTRDVGADVLHGDLDLITDVIGWLLFGIQYGLP